MKTKMTTHMMTALALAILIAGSPLCLRAQSTGAADSCYTLGIFGGVQFNTFNGTYGQLPGTENCCPSFNEGSATKPYFGILFGIPVMPWLSAQLRAGMANFGLDHTMSENIGNALVREGNDFRVVDAISEHTNTTSIGTFEFSPRLLAYPIATLPLAVHAGLSALFVTGFNVTQEEKLTGPGSAVFADTRTSSRNSGTKEVTGINSFHLAPIVGLNYDIHLGSMSQWTIAPEVSYIMPLGSFVTFPSTESNSTYKVSGIRAGLSILYSLSSVRAEDRMDLPRKRLLATKVEAREILATGERPLAIVKVKETISSQLYPLIPYVFFDESSYEGPVRYRKYTVASRRSFDTTKLFRFDNTDNRAGITLDVYYNIMNIIGARMQRFPGATLNINGFNNDRGSERNNKELSRRRAEWVRDYLRDVWQIPESRLIVSDGNLSSTAAKTTMSDTRDREDGYEENRRVEFKSSEIAILQPLQVFDTLRTVENPRIRFTMTVRSDTSINSWSLAATHPDLVEGNTTIVNKRGEGNPDQFLEWSSENSQRSVPKSQEPINVTFTVRDDAQNDAKTTSKLPVKISTIAERRKNMEGNIEVNTYRIVGFDYESAGANTTTESIINGFIKQDVAAADTIEIRGYTDRKGDVEANQQLATQRANSMAGLIKPMTSAAKVTAKGMREEQSQFENAQPEQRLYNRMVEVVVRKNAH